MSAPIIPSTPEKRTETLGEQAWNTFRALMLALFIIAVVVIGLLAWQSHRPAADPAEWSKYQNSTTTQRY